MNCRLDLRGFENLGGLGIHKRSNEVNQIGYIAFHKFRLAFSIANKY